MDGKIIFLFKIKKDIPLNENTIKRSYFMIKIWYGKVIRIHNAEREYMDKALNYLKNNEAELLNQLKTFLSIPSISTDSDHKKNIINSAEFVKDYVTEIGFNHVEIMETDKHPLIFAENNKAGRDAPTVLIYGDYDVQPTDPLEAWESAPFEPEIRDGRLYARGASDDKGQVFMHLAVLEAFMKTEETLPLNVKLCIEGEEEIG